jgi:hypothetical protein
VGPRACVNVLEKKENLFFLARNRNPNRPTRRRNTTLNQVTPLSSTYFTVHCSKSSSYPTLYNRELMTASLNKSPPYVRLYKSIRVQILSLFCPPVYQFILRMRTALFWVITQRAVVTSYRRFGTTYRSYPQGSRIKRKPIDPIRISYSEDCGRLEGLPIGLMRVVGRIGECNTYVMRAMSARNNPSLWISPNVPTTSVSIVALNFAKHFFLLGRNIDYIIKLFQWLFNAMACTFSDTVTP